MPKQPSNKSATAALASTQTTIMVNVRRGPQELLTKSSNVNIVHMEYIPTLNQLLVSDVETYMFLDPNTKTLIKRTMRDESHIKVCAFPDGSLAYLSKQEGSYTIEKVDTSNNKKIWKCVIRNDKWPFPSFMVFLSKLNILLVGINNTIYKVDANGKLLETLNFTKVKAALNGAGVDAQGRILIFGSVDEEQHIFLLDGKKAIDLEKALVTVPGSNLLMMNDSLLVSKHGNLFTVDGQELGMIVEYPKGEAGFIAFSNDRLFYLNEKFQIVMCTLSIEQTVVDYPLEMAACRDIERLGGQLPKVFRHFENVKDADSFFLSVDWGEELQLALTNDDWNEELGHPVIVFSEGLSLRNFCGQKKTLETCHYWTSI